MNYATVCSGAEAFGPFWHNKGFTPVFHSEIDKDASALLRFKYPTVKNHGDFTTINTDDYPPGSIQLLAGGTPCQSFSIAGLGGGLEDARGNLSLSFIKLAQQLRPRWVFWENVPGVLSNDGGRAFASILGGLAHIGYGFAYRVLDAQYFGVPQRRKRVFVVGCLGDWRSAAAVLFESHSLQGYPAPSREAGQEVAGTFTARANSGGWCQDVDLASSGYMRPVDTFRMVAFGEYSQDGTASSLKSRDFKDATDLIAFDTTQITSPQNGSNPRSGEPCHPLASQQHAPTIAFKVRSGCEGGGKGYLGDENTSFTLCANDDQKLFAGYAVRRLMPIECERLQGWEDDWTRYGINDRGKQYELSDSARYRIIGNGWAAPVANWIAARIKHIDQLTQ